MDDRLKKTIAAIGAKAAEDAAKKADADDAHSRQQQAAQDRNDKKAAKIQAISEAAKRLVNEARQELSSQDNIHSTMDIESEDIKVSGIDMTRFARLRYRIPSKESGNTEFWYTVSIAVGKSPERGHPIESMYLICASGPDGVLEYSYSQSIVDRRKLSEPIDDDTIHAIVNKGLLHLQAK